MNRLSLAGAVAAAVLSLPVGLAWADPVISQTVTSVPVAPAPVVTQERTTTVTPAPVLTERHDSTTTTTTTSNSAADKERMEKERDLRKDIRDANRERDEKVRDAIEESQD